MMWPWIGIGIVVLVVALVVIWTLRRSAEQSLPTAGTAPRGPDPELDAAVAQLLAEGRKLEAIRRVRVATGMGLAEAKAYVERPRAGHATPEHRVTASAPGDLDAELRVLVARGRTIEAIKRVREATGVGLKEAKDYVDQLRAG